VVRQALVEAIPLARFRDVPIGRKALLRGGLAHFFDARGTPVLLGGGTVLGRTIWRTHLRRTQRFFSPSRWEMLGAGVEDPGFVGTRQYTSEAEIGRWKPLLGRFRNITVRGPRSQSILADHGIKSTVVGDPALLLKPKDGAPSVRACDLLVNATCGEDQWGGVDLDWTPALVRALAPMVRAGLTIEFVSMEPTDEAWNRRVAEALQLRPVIHKPTDCGQFFAIAAASKLVIGTRLHCNVLASAADTPTISLEYRPKSRDFMESIGCGSMCHRVDQLDPSELERSIADTLNTWSDSRERVRRGVDALRIALRDELRNVSRALLDVRPNSDSQ
jgi:Polysaccharide pyruvyl transferase